MRGSLALLEPPVAELKGYTMFDPVGSRSTTCPTDMVANGHNASGVSDWSRAGGGNRGHLPRDGKIGEAVVSAQGPRENAAGL